MNCHLPVFGGERAIFDGIGAKLMQRHDQQQRLVAAQRDIRAGDVEAFAGAFLERRQGERHKIGDCRTFPILDDKQIIGVGQSSDPGGKGAPFLLRRIAKCLGGDRRTPPTIFLTR